MSDTVMVVVLVGAVAIVVTAMVVGLVVLRMLLARPSEVTVSASEQATAERQEALPVDPDNLPSWKVYSPRKGAPGRACACHPDRPLVPGQKVLWWPVPKSGGAVNVYCEDGVEV